jgi:hypothetical protein
MPFISGGVNQRIEAKRSMWTVFLLLFSFPLHKKPRYPQGVDTGTSYRVLAALYRLW